MFAVWPVCGGMLCLTSAITRFVHDYSDVLLVYIMKYTSNYHYSWWHSIVVRPLVLAGKLSLSCARLTAGRVTTLWVKRPLSVNQHGQLSQPSLRSQLNE